MTGLITFGNPASCCCAVSCNPCPLPIDTPLTLYMYRLGAVLSGGGLCGEDEFLLDLNWNAGTINRGGIVTKAGYYYTDCVLLDQWAEDEYGACYVFQQAYVRWVLGCRTSDSAVVLWAISYDASLGPGDPGLTPCEDDDPPMSTLGHGGQVEAEDWDVTAICDPFELREQQFTGLFGEILLRDFWVYLT